MDEELEPEVVELLGRHHTDQIKTWSLVKSELLDDEDLPLRLEVRSGDANGFGEYLVADIRNFTLLLSHDSQKDRIFLELRTYYQKHEEMGEWLIYNNYPVDQHEVSLQVQGLVSIIERAYLAGVRSSLRE